MAPPDRRPTLPAPGGVGGLSDPAAKARRSAGSRTKLLLGSVITVAVVAAAAGVGVWIATGEDPSSSGENPSSTVDADRRSNGQEASSASTKPSEPSESEGSITDADRAEVLQFAEQASEALFARNYRDYDEDVSKALGFLTESFAADYQATTDDVRKEFIANRTTVEVREVGSGTISVEPDVAYVLVFENQYVTRGSGDDASTTYTPYRVILTLARNGDGWLVDGVETDDDRDAPAESDPELAAILDAARQMVLAFLNLDYRTIQEDTAEVLALATGPFARQYQQAAADLEDVTVRSQAVQQADVSAAGIVQNDSDSATVIVATTGTVTNDQTDGEPVARTYRLRLDLEFVAGEWLTSDLEYVR